MSQDKLTEDSLVKMGVGILHPDQNPPPEKRFFHYEEVDGHTNMTVEQQARIFMGWDTLKDPTPEYAFYYLTKQWIYRGDAKYAAWDPATKSFVVGISTQAYKRAEQSGDPYCSTFESVPVRFISPQAFRKLVIINNEIVGSGKPSPA